MDAVPRDDVSLGCRQAADDVAGRLDVDAVQAVAAINGTGDIGSQIVAHNDIAAAAVSVNAIAVEAIDHQTADRGPAAGDSQAVGAKARSAAVQLNDRCAGEIRFARAVDDHGIGDVWQG